jgi:AcrR family transcriptional regulator
MGTKEKISRKALEFFNQNGIEYVGMRELAASLSMQIGNITYYFPTKDDLVNQLALELSALNAKTLHSTGDLTMLTFLERQETVFKNQTRYRCLFLSFVHLIRQNPIIAERYKNIVGDRGESFLYNIRMLQKGKYLVLKSRKDIDFLAGALGLIARFWISEAAILYGHLPVKHQIRHYLGLITGILEPYATKKGYVQIEEFLNK